MGSRNNTLIFEMIKYFHGDCKRIQHFIKVYEYAKLIGEQEIEDKHIREVLETAAIVHDIGIKIAEEQYGIGVCGGDLQQKLGPPEARKMLEKLGSYQNDEIKRVCYLVAHHHTYTNIDGTDLQILIEADFLVNTYEDGLGRKAVAEMKKRVFCTKTGICLLDEIYGL